MGIVEMFLALPESDDFYRTDTKNWIETVIKANKNKEGKKKNVAVEIRAAYKKHMDRVQADKELEEWKKQYFMNPSVDRWPEEHKDNGYLISARAQPHEFGTELNKFLRK